MNNTELFDVTAAALQITGPPEWNSPELIPHQDVLVFLSDEDSESDPIWALMAVEEDDPEYEPLDTAMAQSLIEAHLSHWLLDRCWQIQVAVRKEKQSWRLVDCLSIGDGGGDRLDDDYPMGDSQLTVMCESVVLLGGGSV